MMPGFKVILCIAALFMLVVSSESFAAVWISDNFDQYSLGGLDGQGNWAGTPEVVQVQTDYVLFNKSIKADYLTYGAGDVSQAVTTAGGYHFIDFDTSMDTASSTPGENLAYFMIFGTNGLEITRIYISHGQFKVLIGPGPATVLMENVSPRTWHHIRLGINLSNNKIDVWMNGVQKVTEGSFHNPASFIGRISFGQWPNLGTKFTKSETCIDNLICNSVQIAGTGKLLLSPMIPWTCWEAYNVFYPYVFYDDSAGIYRMYYTGSGAAQANDSVYDIWDTGIVTSSDCEIWKRRPDDYEPVLYASKYKQGELLDPQEQSQTFDSMFACGACVIKDGSTYKMWYTGWNGDSEHIGNGSTRRINFRIGYATSPDGLNWTKQSGLAGAGSVLGLGASGSQDAKGAGAPHVLKEGSTYRMWYEGFDGSTWRIMYATSADGVSWTKQGTALSPGTNGALDFLGARNPVVIRRGEQYELWYQGQTSTSPNYHVLRALSQDGVAWAKAAGQVDLHPVAPPVGDGDPIWNASDPSTRIHVDSIILKPDNSCLVFYAKEVVGYAYNAFGNAKHKRYHIYSEVVNP